MDAARRYHRRWKWSRRRRAFTNWASGWYMEAQIALLAAGMVFCMWLWGLKLWVWFKELWATNCMLIILKYSKEMLPPFC